MMKLKNLVENFDLAKFALNNWPHDKEGLDARLEQFRISSNAVYPFTQNGRLCFLRLAPPEEKSLSAIKAEVDFILYLRQNKFPAMEPIAANNGKYVLELNTPWGIYYATAFCGVEGEPIEDGDFGKKQMFEYGKTLGLLHRLSAAYKPITPRESYLDALERTRNALKEYNCPECAFMRLDSVEKELAALAKTGENFGLVHYDFETDNVFYNPDCAKCSVIDFDDSMYHWYAVDIEQALDSILNEGGEAVYPAARQAFLAGYTTEHTFDERDEAALGAMRRFCDIYAYARLRHCLSAPTDPQPRWMVELGKKLSEKAAFMEAEFVKNP